MDASAAAIGNYYITYYLIIGVDIGSLKSVLAAVRKGGIDIILSDTTNLIIKCQSVSDVG
jgi:hypothetical protein